MPGKGHTLDMAGHGSGAFGKLRSMEARGSLPRKHLGRGGNVSWDFGLFAALQLCSTLPGRPPRPPRAVLKPQHGGTGALVQWCGLCSGELWDGVRHCIRSDEVSAQPEGGPFQIASIPPHASRFKKQRFGVKRSLGQPSHSTAHSHHSNPARGLAP
jgi:hypothetical protein